MKTPKKLLFSLFTVLSLVVVGQVEANTLVPTKVEDLQIKCQGVIKVLSTEKSYFHPNWNTRVGPKAGTNAILQVVELNSPGCTVLSEKYKLDLEKEIKSSLNFPASFTFPTSLNSEVILNPGASLSQPQCQRTRLGCQFDRNLNFVHAVHQAAKDLVGKNFNFSIHQSFKYANHHGYLPFFGKAHQETIYIGNSSKGERAYLGGMSLKLDKFSTGVFFPINVQSVYKLQKPNHLSDKKKIELIAKLPNTITSAYKFGQYHAKNFVELMLELQPSNPFILSEFFNILLNLFKDGPLDAWKVGHFHDAETLVSKALKKLSHHKEIEIDQVLEFVATIPKTISSSFSSTNCVNLDEGMIEDYLLDTLNIVTIGISKTATGTKDAVKYFLQGNFCKYPISQTSKNVGKSLLNLLP